MTEFERHSSVQAAICEQLSKLETDTGRTAASDFAVAQGWEKWNTRLGFAIVITSGAVSIITAMLSAKTSAPVLPINQAWPLGISTMLASLTAVVGSILTFLKPAERASRYREFGNKQKSLRNRIRVYRTVSISFSASEVEKHDALQAFLLEKGALNSDNPPIPRWAYVRTLKEAAGTREQRVI